MAVEVGLWGSWGGGGGVEWVGREGGEVSKHGIKQVLRQSLTVDDDGLARQLLGGLQRGFACVRCSAETSDTNGQYAGVRI